MGLSKIMLEEAKIAVVVAVKVQDNFYVKGYHAYQPNWIPIIGECLLNERESEKPIDKHTVCMTK